MKNKAVPIVPYVGKDGNPIPILFKNYDRGMDFPIICYSDMQCILKKIEENAGINTRRCHRHIPSGYGFFRDTFDWSVIPHYLEVRSLKYRDEYIMNIFLENLEIDAKFIIDNYLRFKKDIVMTPQDQFDFMEATICHICEHLFEEDDLKFKDHCHITGLEVQRIIVVTLTIKSPNSSINQSIIYWTKITIYRL